MYTWKGSHFYFNIALPWPLVLGIYIYLIYLGLYLGSWGSLNLSVAYQRISFFVSFGFCLMNVAPCCFIDLNWVIFIVNFSLENYVPFFVSLLLLRLNSTLSNSFFFVHIYLFGNLKKQLSLIFLNHCVLGMSLYTA